MLVIGQEAVIDTCGEDNHLCIFAKGVVVTCTPNHIYIRIQAIHESIYLTHLTDKQWFVFACIDIEEYLLGIGDVTAVEQWRLKGIDNCLLHTSLTARSTNSHDGTTAFTHRCFHIAEVKINAALNGNQLGYALSGIAENIVRSFESILDRELRVGIDIADALIINNKGNGEAKNVRMLTEQPKIVDNEKGLLIDFQLVSSQVNGEPATLSFGKTIANNFGTIPAHSQVYGQWWLESSLLGHFTSYEVEATHVTSYGNQNLSLIDTVTIHEMIHGFTDATLLSSKPRRGYLVNDIVDADDLPDVVYFTDATQQPLYISTGNIDRLGDSEYMLNATTKQQGWNYGSIADPTGGKLKLASITRSRDGAELPIDNMWQTSRTLRDAREWLYENRLHYVAWLPESGESYLLKFIKDDVVGIDTAEADGEQNGNIHLRMSGGWLTVTGNFHELRSIELYDIRGVKQLATVRQQLGYPVSISSLPSGVYFVRVTTDRGICHAKVLKK